MPKSLSTQLAEVQNKKEELAKQKKALEDKEKELNDLINKKNEIRRQKEIQSRSKQYIILGDYIEQMFIANPEEEAIYATRDAIKDYITDKIQNEKDKSKKKEYNKHLSEIDKIFGRIKTKREKLFPTPQQDSIILADSETPSPEKP